MASLGELFIELGVKADTQTLKNVSDSIKGLRTNLLLVGAAFTGAIVGLDRFVQGTLSGVVALQNLNQQTGLSIEELQKFQQAGQLANLSLSADQIAASIGNVQKKLAEIRLGGGNIAPFNLLGISPLGQDAFSVIEQLRDRVQGLDPTIATNLISQLGLSPEFINILRLSREEFDKLSQNTFLSKEQRGDIDRLGTSFKALTLNFKALKDQAVAKIAPQLDELVQKFFKWLKDNGDRIVNTISSLARGFTAFATAIGNAFALTGRFLENIMGLENGIKVLSIAFAALSLSFSPFLLGLTAIILLLDDIAVYKSGGESLIGDLVKSFKDLPNLGKILFGVGGVAAIATLAKNITLLGAAFKGLSGLSAILAPITAFLSAAVFFANAPSIGKKVADLIDETAANDKDSFSNKLQFFIDRILGNTPEQTFQRIGLNPALSAQALQITNNNNISINGIQEPTAVRNELNNLNGGITTNSLKQVQSTQGGFR